MRNFIPIRSGAAMSRGGTDHCGVVKDVTAVTRLKEFIFSVSDGSQNYILEFGNLYVRFWQDGGQVLNGGIPYEVATPYATADLPLLKLVQQGDVITITCP